MTSQHAKRAKQVLERRRQKAETDAIVRRATLLDAVPGLALLEQKSAAAGAAAARLATEGQKQAAEEKLLEVQDIKARKALLLGQHGYTEADLKPKYACAECNDTGRTKTGETCECMRREIARLRREAVNETGPLRLCRFENFLLDYYPDQMEGAVTSPRQVMERILRDCKDYAADFGPGSRSLLLFGDAGLGKTHLALSIAGAVLDKGYDVIYVSAQSAFAELSTERFNGGGQLLQAMLQADLLVLDDLGTEYLDSYVLSRLYEIVNSRMQRRPTIYTTNICKQDLLNARYTEKIASRLMGECHRMRFLGKDIRLQK